MQGTPGDDFDTRMMRRALELALAGQYSAMPNPHVGCVLVREGRIVGEGSTQPAGADHAEIRALAAAGGEVRGATAYVTLEPCSHRGRTGPCVEALIGAGIQRAVIALADPNPLVDGGGIARLRARGAAGDVGLLEAEARAVIPGFLARMERGRGRVRAKLAMSMDGRTAMASGESQWITGPAARRDVQRLRAMSCAILTGSGTVLADDCALTVRQGELALDTAAAALAVRRQPLRAVLDTNLRTPPGARVLRAGGQTLLFHAEAVPVPEPLLAGGAQCVALPGAAGGLDLRALFEQLTRRQCNEILVESGPRLTGALLRAGLLDELIIYMAPLFLGDRARPLLQLPLDTLAEKVALETTDVSRVGDDWRFTVRPRAIA